MCIFFFDVRAIFFLPQIRPTSPLRPWCPVTTSVTSSFVFPTHAYLPSRWPFIADPVFVRGASEESGRDRIAAFFQNNFCFHFFTSSIFPAIKAAYKGKCCFSDEIHTYTTLHKMTPACYAVLRHLGIMVEGNTHACTRHWLDGAILGKPLGKTATTRVHRFQAYGITRKQAAAVIEAASRQPETDPEIAQLSCAMDKVAVASPVPSLDEEFVRAADNEIRLRNDEAPLIEAWQQMAIRAAVQAARERDFSFEGVSPFAPYIPRPVEVPVAPISRGRDTWPGTHDDHFLTVAARLEEINALARRESLDDGSDDEGRRKRPCSPLALSDSDGEPASVQSDDDEATDEDSSHFNEYDHIDSFNPFSSSDERPEEFFSLSVIDRPPLVSLSVPIDFDPAAEFLAPIPKALEQGYCWSLGPVRLPIPRLRSQDVPTRS